MPRLLPSSLPIALVCLLAVCARSEANPYPWKPDRPITLVVPWAAGGSTDQMARIVAGEVEAALGQKVVVVNRPGATGSTGVKTVLEAAPDGFTWCAGSTGSLGTYALLGLLETRLDDWQVFTTVANVPVVSVGGGMPHADFGAWLADLKARPGEISVSTAGLGSTGHRVMELIAQKERLAYRHVPHPGGKPAALATASGEVSATTQLAADQADLIRTGRLRPLAALSREPLELAGHGSIPPVTRWLPDLKISTDYFGIWVRKGSPPEVIETMERLWVERIANSAALRRYAAENGAIFIPSFGVKARALTWETVVADAWALHQLGLTKRSPEEMGIPRP
jgi:tripartite-type tricarboxylate transporter receptor subunit TctC